VADGPLAPEVDARTVRKQGALAQLKFKKK
jgi:hypothetical protein